MLRFTSRPFREEPVIKTVALIVIMLGVSAGSGWFMGGASWGVFAFLVLVFAMRGYFLASEFVLDDTGIEIRQGIRRRSRPWSDFRRVSADEGGVFLSPFTRASRLDAFRGEYLRCPGQQTEVADFARSRIRQSQNEHLA